MSKRRRDFQSSKNSTRYGPLTDPVAHGGRADDASHVIREGWLKINIESLLALAEAALAHRRLEERHSMGEIVLTV